MTGIIYHSALYNGLSGSRIKGDIQPAWTGYLYENIQSDKDISESRVLRDGILATFLKYIDWELMLNRQ